MRKNWFQTILTAVILLGITTAIYLYTAGYRLDKESNGDIDFKKTGMIGVKSIPDGAKVYLDADLVTATDNTISSVDPGTHNLKIVKSGFVVWEKDIEVFPELVTDITAILVSQTPRLEPLTNTGARVPIISPSLSKLAFFSKDGTNPGVWVIPLTDGGLSLFRSNPNVVLDDTPYVLFSHGKSIEWSPDEKQLLVETSESTFYLVDLETGDTIIAPLPELILEKWQEELSEKRSDFIDKIDIPDELVEIAMSPDTLWAPDDKKFLYKKEVSGKIEYGVYNMEKPIPVGEKVESLVFTSDMGSAQPAITWYSDSFHLILAEGNIDEEKEGLISLIRIDGSNKTEVYSNSLHSKRVYSAPGGDKLIVLTSLKSGEQTDLYTIGMR